MIDSRSLINSPITRGFVKKAVSIWGPSEGTLKDKTTRAKSDTMTTGEEIITPLPPQVLELNGSVILGIDVIKVNGVPFLVTYARVITFETSIELVNTKVPSIVKALILVLKTYGRRDFKVEFITADNGFASLPKDEKYLALGVILNLISEDEHEPFI